VSPPSDAAALSLPTPAAGKKPPVEAVASTGATAPESARRSADGQVCGDDDGMLALLDDPAEQARYTTWREDTAGVRTAESSWQIGGMYCAACAGTIEQALQAVPGVLDAQVSAAAQRARVRWDPAATRPSAMVRAVRAAGYQAVPDGAVGTRALRERERRAALWRLFVAAFCSMQVMMLATPGYVADRGDLAPDLAQLLNWGMWLLCIPVLLFSSGPFLAGAWRSLRSRRIGMDVPVALGIVVTFAASTGATFAPGGVFGSEVYFDSLAMFLSFLLGGRYLEMLARHRAATSLESMLGNMPEAATRIGADGLEERVSTLRLAAGDQVRVPLGEAFPADGALLDGRTQVDESLLTGESTPCVREVGDAVVAGSVNLGAPVLMRVERVGAATRRAAIVDMVRDAMFQRPASARLADAWAVPFLWAVLVAAAVAAVVWHAIDPNRALGVAVSVLIVTCPCALSLATPSALLSAAGWLARHGLVLQRVDAIEKLAGLQRLFVDKTGTLTEDRLHCVAARDLVLQSPATEETSADAWRHAWALASRSSHPLSRALIGGVPGLREPAGTAVAWSVVREHAGDGLEGIDGNGVQWRLGRTVWAAPAVGVDAGDGSHLAEGLHLTLSRDGRPVLSFDVRETLRADSIEAIAALRRQGIAVELLSGDAPSRVAAVAEQVGVDAATASADPTTKLRTLQAAQQRGECVGMVGDGVNDAPVLAQADVSFAMGQGALVSRVHADGVIVSNRLGDLVAARDRARRALRIVRQNLAWAAAYNAVCVPLALIGWLPPWAAGLGMATSSLFVVMNASRLSR